MRSGAAEHRFDVLPLVAERIMHGSRWPAVFLQFAVPAAAAAAVVAIIIACKRRTLMHRCPLA